MSTTGQGLSKISRLKMRRRGRTLNLKLTRAGQTIKQKMTSQGERRRTRTSWRKRSSWIQTYSC